MDDDTESRIRRLNHAIWGDPDRPRDNPGLVMDVSIIKIQQAEMKKTLDEVNDNIKRAMWLVFAMFLTALGGLIWRVDMSNGTSHKSAAVIVSSPNSSP